MDSWESYAHYVTRGDSLRDIGRRIGRSHSTARRWMLDTASPDQVIALTLAYGGDIIEAFVAAGWLDAEEVKNVNMQSALRQLSSVELIRELYRRALDKQSRDSDGV